MMVDRLIVIDERLRELQTFYVAEIKPCDFIDDLRCVTPGALVGT